MAAHDLHNGRTVVGAAGGADGADGFHAGVDGAVVAQRHFGVGQVVVDRAGNADAGDAEVAQRLRTLEGAVAADDDDALDAHVADVLGGLLLHLRPQELEAARGAQVGAGLVGDVQNGVKVQFGHAVLLDVERAVVAALDAHQGHAVVARSLGYGHDGCIHARGVAAGGQNANSTHKNAPLLLKEIVEGK